MINKERNAALGIQPSVLLVEPDPELKRTRELLLSALEYPIIAVCSYVAVCKLPPETRLCLVVVDLSPSEREAMKIAAHARRLWTDAFILLLGTPSGEFDDPLYDEAVNPCFNPAGVVTAATQLLSSHARSLEIQNRQYKSSTKKC